MQPKQNHRGEVWGHHKATWWRGAPSLGDVAARGAFSSALEPEAEGMRLKVGRMRLKAEAEGMRLKG